MAAIKKEDVLTYLENANMLEISELIKDIEDKFGVIAAAPVAVAGGAAPPVGSEGSVEEKTEFDIELTGIGEKKINVIKIIRTITSLGLKEAKEMVDGAPTIVKEAATKEVAEDIRKQLEEAGATVTLK